MVKSPYVRLAFAGRERVHSMQMVNAGFPERTLVWFRNGGCIESTAKARSQSKIYTKSNQSGFLQIFDDLSSTQHLRFIDGC
jgi:hypothetical protein